MERGINSFDVIPDSTFLLVLLLSVLRSSMTDISDNVGVVIPDSLVFVIPDSFTETLKSTRKSNINVGNGGCIAGGVTVVSTIVVLN